MTSSIRPLSMSSTDGDMSALATWRRFSPPRDGGHASTGAARCVTHASRALASPNRSLSRGRRGARGGRARWGGIAHPRWPSWPSRRWSPFRRPRTPPTNTSGFGGPRRWERCSPDGVRRGRRARGRGGSPRRAPGARDRRPGGDHGGGRPDDASSAGGARTVAQ